ncbi:MAG: LysM peptidoglycan-binding domain-containing protein [Gammaproteobacteria bacterium]|nr:LysM peptidoglycan-binding domain-containing protein [Gammaproteobacteria bacterium]
MTKTLHTFIKFTLTLIFLPLFFTVSGCQTFEVNKESTVSETEPGKLDHETSKTIIINKSKDNEVVVKTLATDDTSSPALSTSVPALLKEIKVSPLDDPDSDIWTVLPELYNFSFIENPAIQKEIQFYLKQANHFDSISEKAKPFLYYIFNEVKRRKLPGELVLLPIVESAFNTYAYSHGRASGIWQFIPSTGKEFGLDQNWWYDGRRDIYRSTNAALDYLQQLNARFEGDWLLTLAAYNAGAGNVNKAIKKNSKRSKSTEFWNLKLPKETRQYVPRLIALAKLIKDKNRHNLILSEIANQPYLKYVDTLGQIDLAIAADLAKISIEDIYQFNPAFNQWATPPQGPHKLFIPVSAADEFEKNIQALAPKKRLSWQRYKIKSGDSLIRIAKKFNVSTSQLKIANHLNSHKIRAGKYLMIPSASEKNQFYSQSVANRRDKILKNIRSKNKKIHRVRAGESLWTIARKYHISHKKLAKRNHISTRQVISIGQKLVVWSDIGQPSYHHEVTRHKVNQNKSTGVINSSKIKPIKYKIKSGDSLYEIAKRFNVSINQITKWNDLNKNKYLKIGKTIVLYDET